MQGAAAACVINAPDTTVPIIYTMEKLLSVLISDLCYHAALTLHIDMHSVYTEPYDKWQNKAGQHTIIINVICSSRFPTHIQYT